MIEVDTGMVAQTAEQMRIREEEAARTMNAWFVAYREFPTATNFDGLVEQMRGYQTAWMHGRKRP